MTRKGGEQQGDDPALSFNSHLRERIQAHSHTHTHTDTHTDRPEPSIEHERAVAGELGEHLHQVVADKGKTQKNLTRRQKNQKVTENIR